MGGVISFWALGCNPEAVIVQSADWSFCQLFWLPILLDLCDLCAIGNHVDLTDNVLVCMCVRGDGLCVCVCVCVWWGLLEVGGSVEFCILCKKRAGSRQNTFFLLEDYTLTHTHTQTRARRERARMSSMQLTHFI